MSTESSACATSGTEPSFLDRTVRWWHAGFGVLATIDGVGWLLLPDLTLGTRALGLGILGCIVLAYLWIGRQILMRDAGTGRAIGYLVILCAGIAVMTQLHDFNHILLFVAFPHIWSMLPVRRAIPFASLVTLVVVSEPIVAEGWTSGAIASGAITGVMTLGMGVLLSLWITGIIQESERRKALIAELERARAELANAHHREGVLAERERLATEIHDTLAQGFMSILMLSQAPGTPDQLERIGRTAKENLAEARSLIEALGPDDLHRGTLADACRRVVERLDAEPDVDARFVLRGEPRTLPANTEIVLLRATQEALTNVRKHAKANQANVVLSYEETATSAEISDDGAGFDPGDADGFGLRGMRGRADQVGGTVDVESVPGQGTTIRVVVP